jgi:gliding motility-associated-like protein
MAFLHGSSNAPTVAWTSAGTIATASALTTTATPLVTSSYILTAYDNRGCPKPGRDTVIVTVLPKIIATAGRDTSVIVGQQLRLNAGTGVKYQWIPSTNLSSSVISNPVAIYTQPSDGIRYRVLVSDQAGCVDSASVTVRVFKTGPRIFVPSAFTPDNNGRNDRLRPIAVGMKQLTDFIIYNRWGQKVFSSVDGSGWDGMLGGRPQGADTYVWTARAIDFNGAVYSEKGIFILLR